MPNAPAAARKTSTTVKDSHALAVVVPCTWVPAEKLTEYQSRNSDTSRTTPEMPAIHSP